MARKATWCLVAAILLCPTHLFGADAKRTDIYMQVYSDYEEFVRNQWVPVIEKALPVSMHIEPGVSADAMAKMRAEKAAPKHQIMFMDSPIVAQAKMEGLTAPLDKPLMPNLANIYPQFVLEDGYGVGIGAAAMGIAYNPKLYPPPASWADLWKPEYKGQVSIPTFTQTNGIVFWIMAGAIKTGKTPQEALKDPDACFAGVKSLLPNVQSLWVSDAQQLQMLSNGDLVYMASANTKGTYANRKKGLSVEWAEPKEGAFQLLNSAIVVKNPDANVTKLSMQVLNLILSAENQKILIDNVFVGPTNSKVKAPDWMATTKVPFGPDAVKRLIQVDWRVIQANRDTWTERWNKEIVK